MRHDLSRAAPPGLRRHPAALGRGAAGPARRRDHRTGRGARLAAFLRAAGEAVAAPVVGIAWFLRLQWAIEGQVDLFPGRPFPLLDGWAAEAAAGIG